MIRKVRFERKNSGRVHICRPIYLKPDPSGPYTGPSRTTPAPYSGPDTSVFMVSWLKAGPYSCLSANSKSPSEYRDRVQGKAHHNKDCDNLTSPAVGRPCILVCVEMSIHWGCHQDDGQYSLWPGREILINNPEFKNVFKATVDSLCALARPVPWLASHDAAISQLKLYSFSL